ncbi:sensor histidine kinase [Microbispora sp. RL4-1S]|uniref:histidine kinase n=1 Tax=Microbispora oryzae TaxID=2806554 RepID=A0A941AIU6_9ACTN|nr:nitrate- and nitrite sensing domain-containing protein [Microbispora oryzae]MBP2705551.1 sensor histidine kinase [Microbispora oryzae]
MRFRNSRIRTKVAALLVSLTALWAFAAWVTLREGVTLVWTATLNTGVIQPSQPLLTELQEERRLSVLRVAAPSPRARQELERQRARTDSVLADFERLAGGKNVDLAASPAFKARLNQALQQLQGLTQARKAIDTTTLDRVQTGDAITQIIDSIYRMYDSLTSLDDEQVARDAQSNVAMNRAREQLAQEDALAQGALAAGQFAPAELARFTQLVGVQRWFTDKSVAELPTVDQEAYRSLAATPKFQRLRQMEDMLTQNAVPRRTPPVTAEQWRQVAQGVLTDRARTLQVSGDALIQRAGDVGAGIVVRLVLAGGLGLLAVVASIVLSITTARALVAQLEKLRAAALELANERLPGVVARLAQGEKVDVRVEAPPLEFGTDLIGQVGSAFNTVQETAIRTAVEEAQLRQSIRDILLSLARRTQSLVHRQLTLLDVMERRESDAEELKDLFRIDHLATRMRRNAENLIVLSGASPARAWRRSVPMVDVVRGALAEVEDYTRVTVMPMGQTGLTGRAVGDVIHLLAELIENAVSFSPPYTTVQVGGQVVASGYALEIEDRGLGMSPEDVDAANERIANPPDFNLSSTARLGLYVVSRLAERHGIKVSLKASPYGGTTAVVLLPIDLVIEDGDDLSQGTGPFPEQERGPRKIALVGAPDADPEPAQEVVPVPVVPEPPRPAPPASFTPSGLPFRVPQANLAPALADNTADLDEDDEDDRSPEDIRKIMGSFQSGTRKGRSEAARLQNEGSDDQ